MENIIQYIKTIKNYERCRAPDGCLFIWYGCCLEEGDSAPAEAPCRMAGFNAIRIRDMDEIEIVSRPMAAKHISTIGERTMTALCKAK